MKLSIGWRPVFMTLELRQTAKAVNQVMALAFAADVVFPR